jgi:hypothetical protein
MFPKLPVIEAMLEKVSPAATTCLDGVAIVATQHLLETTGSLLESLIRLGARPEHFFIQGKLYSTNLDVSERLSAMGMHLQHSRCLNGRGNFAQSQKHDLARLWETVSKEITRGAVKSVIVLDDGGHCLAAVPSTVWNALPVVGIEQTTSGLQLQKEAGDFPIIQVASSAAKRHIEPPMVSRAVLTKLHARVPLTTGAARCGVIGIGSIGNAVAKDLLRRGHRVHVYDSDLSLKGSIPGAVWCEGVEELFWQSDYIFGCAGEDVVRGANWLHGLRGCKTLISCSSEDKEFLTVLRLREHEDCAHEGHLLQDITIDLPGCTLTILRGGFPVNFDGSPDSAPGADIQVTRGLLLGGVLQAAICNDYSCGHGRREKLLNPAVQQFIVKKWLSTYPMRRQWYSQSSIACFSDLGWIQSHSSGYIHDCTCLNEMYYTMPEPGERE